MQAIDEEPGLRDPRAEEAPAEAAEATQAAWAPEAVTLHFLDQREGYRRRVLDAVRRAVRQPPSMGTKT